MSRRALYLVLAAVGTVLPWVFFVRFVQAEGPSLVGFVWALFVNGASAGFASDLLVSSVVFWVFLFAEARRVGVPRPWVYVVLNLLVGLSCALPLFLRAREGKRSQATS